jgi:peroxiredoxin
MSIFAKYLLTLSQMRKVFLSFILAVITVMSFSQAENGYQISFTIDGLRDSTLFLAFHLGDKQYIKDTIRVDNSGRGIFSGKENLPQGIYLVVLPGRRYFEILISDDQHFSFTCSYNDPFSTLSFSGTDENSAFVSYQKTWIAMQQRATDLNKRIQNNKQNNDSITILTGLLKSYEEKMKSYLKTVIRENRDNMLSVLVKAILPIDMPVITVPDNSSNPDSLKWVLTYNYRIDHFFDNIDLTDERLIRTPILQSKLNAFFKNMVIQSADSINKEIDRIIEKCSGNYEVFQFVSVFLFNHFRESEIMGHDAVVVKLADDIYLSGKADWVSEEFKDDLRKQVELIRPNLIGRKGENLVMDSYIGTYVSLYDIEKDYTILYFWEPDCGHCNEATSRLKAYYEKARDEGIEIFSVCTGSDKAKWSKYIEDNNLTWINGWDPQRTTRYDYYYNVRSNPMVYILDKNKTIIAKKIAVEDIGSFIDSYRKLLR